MIDLQTISIIIGFFIGMGTLIAGIGFAYAQYKSGGDKAKDELIKTLKETAIVEREKASRLADEKTELIKNHQEQINLLNKNLGILTGKFEEQSKKATEYLSIIQGRDPQQLKYMEEMTRVARLATEYMGETRPIIIKLSEEYNKKHPEEANIGLKKT